MKLKSIALTLSFIIVAFGQPAWSSVCSIFAALFGFALFFYVLITFETRKTRFWTATFWFTGVQLVQLSWALSHPFYYIIVPWILYAFLMGLQFGVLSLFVHPSKMTDLRRVVFIASVWTLMEWSRLFFLSGFSWNPIGLSLAANLFSLQTASIAGVYGLSFLVMLINLLALRTYLLQFKKRPILLWGIVAAFPFLFGLSAFSYHKNKESESFSVVLVQTGFPVEESMCFSSRQEFVNFVQDEWKQILAITAKQKGKKIDLMAIPEMVVPFGTYTFIYPYEKVKKTFLEVYGKESEKAFPSLELPLAYKEGKEWMVSNAYWAQTLANYFDTHLMIGLEDAEDVDGERKYYSAAINFQPGKFNPKRYAKRVLVPMGEYIPFSFCRDLAAMYGVSGSFTSGDSAVVWNCNEMSVGVSICYEEVFGDLMRDNRVLGAKVLLNLTSDAWYPNSKLVRQHLEHSRLRTVENGVPLIRACNTGITCVVDSLGRDIAMLGEDDRARESLSDSLYVNVPVYDYFTLYSRLGDGLIVGLSILFTLMYLRVFIDYN